VKRLDLYIGKTLFATIALAWAVVVALEGVFSFLGEIGDIGRGDYALGDAALFTALGLPERAYQVFPMAALIGALLGLGNLSAQSELNAFRLAGCSPRRLTRSVLQTGMVLLLFAVAAGEGWGPGAQQLAQQVRTSAIFDEVAVQRGGAFWVRDGQRLIQVGQSEADGSLSDIAVFQIDSSPRLVSATAVARASYQQGRWYLQGIRESRFANREIDVRSSDKADWDTLMDPRLARLLTRDQRTLALPELRQYIAYLERNGGNVAAYRLGYWQRIAAPVATIAMLLLSVGFVLGPAGQRGVGQRILLGVLVGLGFKLLTETAAHAGLVYGVPPALSAFLPASAVFVAGLALLRRSA
jgi:lipopolysaccharide export system permease protein